MDTGSTYSMMPTSMLKSMGIIPDEGEEEIFDAFNQSHRMSLGIMRIEYGGKSRPCMVLFGPENQYILGAIALESLAYMVDPVGRQLIPKMQWRGIRNATTNEVNQRDATVH